MVKKKTAKKASKKSRAKKLDPKAQTLNSQVE